MSWLDRFLGRSPHAGLEWLKSPLVCDGRVVRPGLLPDAISDADLPDICLRMHLILDTIEYARCEGRLINLDIFNSIDSMESELRHGRDNQLSDWEEAITQFADYYQLDGQGPIEIAQHSIDSRSYIADDFGIPIGRDS